jgi:pimeloyl-ACP methyl ester carboxylesterase
VKFVLHLVWTVLLLKFSLLGLMAGWLIYTIQTEGGRAEPVPPNDGHFITTRTGRVFTQAAGPAAGKTVLFIHGTAAWSGFWRATIEKIGGAGYRAVAIDLPPFGFSEHDVSGRYRRQDQAERILSLVEAMGSTRPIIVGHSFGAGPVVEAVLKRPDMFGGLVIVAGALALPAEGAEKDRHPSLLAALLAYPFAAQNLTAATITNGRLTRSFLAMMVHNREAASADLADTLSRPMSRAGTTAAYASWLPSLFVDEGTALSGKPDNVRRLAVSTAVVWGRQDSVTPIAQGERIAGLIKGSTFHVLDDVGHIPHIEAPEVFESLLLRLLDRLVQNQR